MVQKKVVTELLYKFVNDLTAVESILKGSIKFTPIRELNDPSELNPTFVAEDVIASLIRLRRDGYTEGDLVHLRRQGQVLKHLAPRFQAARVPTSAEDATALIRLPFYDSISTLERLLLETAVEVSTKVGVFCVSHRYNALPMWAHYAANAAGVVVEFRNLDAVFTGDETGILRQPIAVRYQKERLGVTFEPQSHESMFFDKFEDWNYEQEVRVVLPLLDCRRLDLPAGSLYLYDIPPDCVSRVILGWHVRQEGEALVHAAVERAGHSVPVVRARFNRGRVETAG